MRLPAALVALLLAASALAQDPAPPPRPRPVRVIEVKGPIGPGLVPKVREALEAADPDRLPAGAVLFLDSRGGDGLAAIEIGRLVRSAKAQVFVRGKCWSACVFILAAGVVRGAPDRAVGIHRPRLTTFVKDIGMVDINPSSNPKAAKALEIADRRIADYLRDMGMPDALYKAMMATPSDQNRLLGSEELREFALSGIETAYGEAQAESVTARYKVTAQEYAVRAPQAQDKCLTPTATSAEFVRCYNRVLRTGE